MTRPQIQKLMGAIGLISSGITVHVYYTSLSEPKNSELKSGIETVKTILNEQQTIFKQNQTLHELQLAKIDKLLLSKSNNLKQLIEKIENNEKINKETDVDFHALIDLEKNLKNLISSSNFESSPTTQEAATQNMETALNSYNQMKESTSVDFINNNKLLDEITDYINNYTEWLTSLSLEQQGLMMNISIAFTVLVLTSSLITIFYSDLLITKFNIEKKFPRIGKFLVIRRNFQNYYYFVNSLLIIVLLITALFLNIFAFISSFSSN